MVKAIYFLKPAWCGNHVAGLWPEQGLQPVNKSHRLQAVVCHCPSLGGLKPSPLGDGFSTRAAD